MDSEGRSGSIVTNSSVSGCAEILNNGIVSVSQAVPPSISSTAPLQAIGQIPEPRPMPKYDLCLCLSIGMGRSTMSGAKLILLGTS